MNKNKMKCLMFLMVMCLLVGFSGTVAYAKDDVGSRDLKLVVNGKEIVSTDEIGRPYISKSGRTMLPLRIISETLECSVVYTDGQVFIDSPINQFKATFKVNSPTFVVRGNEKKLDTPMTVNNKGRAYVPARALAETFGSIGWDEKKREVSINAKEWKYDTKDPYFKHRVDVPETDYSIDFYRGDRISTVGQLFIYLIDNKNDSGAVLEMPNNTKDWFTQDNLDNNRLWIKNPKFINGKVVFGLDKALSPTTDFGLEIFAMNSEESVTYLGEVVKTSDYTLDESHLYSTDGLHQGGFSVEPQRLYVSPIGAPAKVKHYDVGFPINECQLVIEGDQLKATAPNGTVHYVDIKKLK